MGITMVMLLSLGIYHYVEYFSSIFTNDANIIDLSTRMFRMISPFYVIFIVSEVFSGAIKGIGDTFLIGTCGFRIMWIVLILPKYPTVMTALLGYPVSWIISTLLFTFLYFFMGRQFSNLKVESATEASL